MLQAGWPIKNETNTNALGIVTNHPRLALSVATQARMRRQSNPLVLDFKQNFPSSSDRNMGNVMQDMIEFLAMFVQE